VNLRQSAAAVATPIVPQRILLVDDDPLILEACRSALEGDGHTVIVARGGQAGIEAFQAAESHGIPFDTVITDLGMPHVDGRQVAMSVKTLAPARPVIMLTGWGHQMDARGDLPQHVDAVLGKPPILAELRAVLAQNLPAGATGT
jgi:DNA-binding response OmpR family regulator